MESKYGTIKTGVGSQMEKELQIVDLIQAQFRDHRLVSIGEIEDGSYLVIVENPESSGRSNQKMWVSKESLIAAFGALTIYSNCKGWDLIEEYKASWVRNGIDYSFSENLKPFKYESSPDNSTADKVQQSSGIEQAGD